MPNPLATVLLGPVLLLQGRRVRREVPRLPEPPGERAGVTGDGPRLRLLVVGDSAAAGVGAAHQDEALTGQLVRVLSPRFELHWRLEAKTGATTASAIEHLRSLPAEPFDVAVTSLGVNDLTAGRRLPAWLQEQAALRDLLRGRFGVGRLLVSGLPPVHAFPALPQPLRWYLGARARAFDLALRQSLAHEPGARHVGFDGEHDVPSMMASDGFHPGPPVYAAWARRLADALEAA